MFRSILVPTLALGLALLAQGCGASIETGTLPPELVVENKPVARTDEPTAGEPAATSAPSSEKQAPAATPAAAPAPVQVKVQPASGVADARSALCSDAETQVFVSFEYAKLQKSSMGSFEGSLGALRVGTRAASGSGGFAVVSIEYPTFEANGPAATLVFSDSASNLKGRLKTYNFVTGKLTLELPGRSSVEPLNCVFSKTEIK
jgi:hypothetical protein